MNDRLHGHIFGTHGTLVGDQGGCKILGTPARLLKKLRSEDASVTVQQNKWHMGRWLVDSWESCAAKAPAQHLKNMRGKDASAAL